MTSLRRVLRSLKEGVEDVRADKVTADDEIVDPQGNSVTDLTSGGGGGISAVESVSSDTTADDGDVILVDASGGVVSITLPGPNSADSVFVKKTDSSSNAVNIETPGSENIDGGSSISITNQYTSRQITSDGSNYFII